MEIIQDHVKFIHSKSPAATQVIWNDDDNRWDVENIYTNEVVQLRNKAVETYVLSQNENKGREDTTTDTNNIEHDENTRKITTDLNDIMRLKNNAEKELNEIKAQYELIKDTKNDMEKQYMQRDKLVIFIAHSKENI